MSKAGIGGAAASKFSGRLLKRVEYRLLTTRKVGEESRQSNEHSNGEKSCTIAGEEVIESSKEKTGCLLLG